MDKRTIVVELTDTHLVNHYGDHFEVFENGHLHIYDDEFEVACYAPGSWKRVTILEE